jgi:glucan phosphoethanolaminetransferase (alkaline phosphatase superfamily)
MATTVSDRSSPTDPRPAASGGEQHRRWPSLRELSTIHRDGPVTTQERRRSAIGAVVVTILLAVAVGAIHLVDGSRSFGRSEAIMFVVIGLVLAVVGYAFPRFTTTPGVAMMSRHPDRNSAESKVAKLVLGLVLFVVAAVKIYY